jgi:phosphoribosyl-ATP pyrophosphohydrolase
MPDFTLNDLAAIVAVRAKDDAQRSYTKSLLDEGMGRIAKKLGEEAVELVIAAVEGHKPAIVSEAADVLYHLMVALHAADISVHDVFAELQHRTLQSGHAEKAGRSSSERLGHGG